MLLRTLHFIIVFVNFSFSQPIISEILLKSKVNENFSLNIDFLKTLPDSIGNRWNQKENYIKNKLEIANKELKHFGIKIILEEKEKVETFRVIKNELVLDSNLQVLEKWETSENSFLIKFGSKFFYNNAVINWDNYLHAYSSPCLLDDSLLHVEKIGEFEQNCNPKTGGRVCCSGINYALLKGTDTIFKFNDSASCIDPLLELLVYKEKWYLQNRFTLLVNGVNFNYENGYGIIYNLRLINNKVLLFYEKKGKHNILFDGKNITNRYDRVTHDLCCEDGLFNIQNMEDKITFFAMNNNNLYYVVMKF